MKTSCNGCRALRKACSQDCTIRPCLDWIKSPDLQANATLFLAKFYGRAGLTNLINAGPQHLRPALFRSLLWEACGRIVNPIYGSVGLLSSGNWNRCHEAVEAVLNGVPIAGKPSEPASSNRSHPLRAYDIRHFSKDVNISTGQDLHKVRTRAAKLSKLSSKSKPKLQASFVLDFATNSSLDQSYKFYDPRLRGPISDEFSHDSSLDKKSEGSKVKLELALGSGTNS